MNHIAPGPIAIYGGVFAKLHEIDRAGMMDQQHSHMYSHLSFLYAGRVRVWCDNEAAIEYEAPVFIRIEAHVAHTFEALVDNCGIACLHSVSGGENADTFDEHTLLED